MTTMKERRDNHRQLGECGGGVLNGNCMSEKMEAACGKFLVKVDASKRVVEIAA